MWQFWHFQCGRMSVKPCVVLYLILQESVCWAGCPRQLGVSSAIMGATKNWNKRDQRKQRLLCNLAKTLLNNVLVNTKPTVANYWRETKNFPDCFVFSVFRSKQEKEPEQWSNVNYVTLSSDTWTDTYCVLFGFGCLCGWVVFIAFLVCYHFLWLRFFELFWVLSC